MTDRLEFPPGADPIERRLVSAGPIRKRCASTTSTTTATTAKTSFFFHLVLSRRDSAALSP